MKLKIAFASLLLSMSGFGAVITLNTLAGFDGAGDVGITLSNGNPVTSGSAQVGYFTVSDQQVLDYAAASDYSTLFSTFVSLGDDNFVDGMNSSYGAPVLCMTSISFSGIVAPTGSHTLYSYFTSGSEIGLFKNINTDPTQPSTLVPDLGGTSPDYNYFLTTASGSIIIGGAGPTYIADYSNDGLLGEGSEAVEVGGSIQLILIPEPSAALLGALGALGLLRRRRN